MGSSPTSLPFLARGAIDSIVNCLNYYRPIHIHCFVILSMAESIGVLNVVSVPVYVRNLACVIGLSGKWGPQ